MLRAVAIALFATVCLPAAAHAEPTFAGAWAENRKSCRIPQEQEGAPMLLSPKGYDQHETHCTFQNLRKQGRTYTADAKCSVQGDSQSMKMVMIVDSRQKMRLSQNGGTTVRLLRCR